MISRYSHIKILLTDIDGVLTDGGMYYTENGDEMKRFHVYDGMALKILMNSGLKTGFLTSENRLLNKKRAEKIGVDYLIQGAKDKLSDARALCEREGFSLGNLAYIGDDINCYNLLAAEEIGLAACPASAMKKVRDIDNILHLKKEGGQGVIRELAGVLLGEDV